MSVLHWTFHKKHVVLVTGLFVLTSFVWSDPGQNGDEKRSVRIKDEATERSLRERSPHAIGFASALPLIKSETQGSPPARLELVSRTETAPQAAPQEEKMATVDGPDVDLSTVERLRLRVFGYAESSGEYGVDLGMISLPGLGRVPVAGKTVRSLEAHISQRLSSISRREVTVSAEVARYQPFYTTGMVARAGAQEWRPGLTLIQAMALAGGILRNGGASDETPERTVALQQTRSQLQFALAQYERLKAEKAGSASMQPSSRLTQLSDSSAQVGKASLSTFLARQNELLDEQRAAHITQIASLERESAAALKEVEAAEVHYRVAGQQIRIARQLMDGLNQLKGQGMVANSRYLAQQNDVLTGEVRLAESRALVERARARVAAIERQITMLRQERRAVLNDRIEILEREIAQHELTLAASTNGRERETGTSTGPSVEFNIARKANSGLATISANLFTEILPGDVIIVSSSSERAARAALSASATTVPGGESGGSVSLARAQRSMDASSVSWTSLTSPDGQSPVREPVRR